jgi:hypothetical protein
MKHVILIISFCSALYTYGQEYRNTITNFEKGTKTFEGGLGFDINSRNTNNNTVNNNFSVSLYPSYGKFIRENLLAGVAINLGYGYQAIENLNSDFSENTNSYNIGLRPFIRKYYILAPGFFIFGQAGLSYSYGWSNSIIEDLNSTINGRGNTHFFSLNAYPGLSFFISPKLALESRLFGLNFFHNKHESSGLYDYNYSSTNLSVGAGLGGINLSLRYFIFPE